MRDISETHDAAPTDAIRSTTLALVPAILSRQETSHCPVERLVKVLDLQYFLQQVFIEPVLLHRKYGDFPTYGVILQDSPSFD